MCQIHGITWILEDYIAPLKFASYVQGLRYTFAALYYRCMCMLMGTNNAAYCCLKAPDPLLDCKPGPQMTREVS